MPSVYDLKPAFQGALRPLVGRLVAAGVTPNQLTLAAALGSCAAGALVAAAASRPRLLLILPLWLFARMALNAMDGMAAREHRRTTRLGGALNEVGDVVADLALYLPIAALSPAHRWPAVAFALSALLTEFCGLLGLALGGTRRYDGPMGKSDRALLIGALGLAGGLAQTTIAWWPPILWAACALALLTCGRRVERALREPSASSSP